MTAVKDLWLLQPGSVLRKIYPGATWHMSRREKVLYLTFDDGPVPGITEWVIDQLERYNAAATFFCVGSNINRHRQIYERLIANGHAIGNHTMNHTNGFGASLKTYLTEVRDCESIIRNKLFRPPYGRLKMNQYKALLHQSYEIVMWDVISYDYESISPRKCARNVISNARNGSIILFHDSEKAASNLRHALPLVLEHFTKKGFSFRTLKSRTTEPEVPAISRS